MRKPDQNIILDWIAITVRWLFLVVVSIWLALDIGFTWPMVAVLSVGGLANIIFTTALLLQQKFPVYRPLNLAADILVAYLLYYFSGPLSSNLGWVSLLPLSTAALYYRWIGASGLAILNLVFEGGLIWPFVPFVDAAIFLLTLLLLQIVAGGGFALLSVRVSKIEPALKTPEPLPRKADSSERERRRLIYALISEMSASLSYQRILETVLDLSTNTLSELGAPAEDLLGMILFFSNENGKGTKLKVESSRLLMPADLDLLLPGTNGILGHTIEEGASSHTKNVSRDPELSQFISLRGYRAAYCAPLRSGLDTYGVMVLAHPDPNFFSTDRRDVLDIVGKQFAIAIQNARLYQDLEQEKERMMEIQEDARKKMARDLHDGPTQSIAAIAMRVNFTRRLLEKDQKAASEELFKIEELARRTTKEIRHMLFTLRPLVLESQGLVAALQTMADKMKDTYDQNVIIQVDQRVVDTLESAKQAVVFYIAEEAVNNARKHAKAAHIWIRLRLLREGLSLLEIEDDGVGFDVSAVDTAYENRGSLGMVNMRERTELVNGVINIKSAVGKGTRIQIAIPLTEAASERLRRGGI